VILAKKSASYQNHEQRFLQHFSQSKITKRLKRAKLVEAFFIHLIPVRFTVRKSVDVRKRRRKSLIALDAENMAFITMQALRVKQ
jgi:hypothetical protein